jgi:hypothetical protein
MKDATRWEFTTGVSPFRVTVFEDVSRGGMVTLRWHVGTGTARRRKLAALGFTVRGARGALDREAVSRAMKAAQEHRAALEAGTLGVVAPEAVKSPLTIQEGWTRAKDIYTGRWNKDTPYRKEMDRAFSNARKHWGNTMTWNAIDKAALRALWRKELARLKKDGHIGHRGARLTLTIVLAVGAWLRDEGLIAPTAALPWKKMDEEFEGDAGQHEPSRPRYTVDEYRNLFAAAWQADERYGLLYDVGAEGRLGQVARSMRSQLNLTEGTLTVTGSGKKKGIVIVLTEAQRENIRRVLGEGYLAGLETAYAAKEIADYPLFPGGHFSRHKDTGRLVSRAEYATRAPVNRTAWREWHREAERLAEIPRLKGRGPYGSRRAGVDAAKAMKISREGLQTWGGWADSQMPDQVYADQEMSYARQEAATVRAQVRGGTVPNELQPSSQIIAPPADSSSAPISPEEHTDA